MAMFLFASEPNGPVEFSAAELAASRAKSFKDRAKLLFGQISSRYQIDNCSLPPSSDSTASCRNPDNGRRGLSARVGRVSFGTRKRPTPHGGARRAWFAQSRRYSRGSFRGSRQACVPTCQKSIFCGRILW